MNFEEFLIQKGIPFEMFGDMLYVMDDDLLPFKDEIKEKFPLFEFEFDDTPGRDSDI